MSIQRIFSRDAAYQKLVVLKTNRYKRARYGEFLVEGVRNINEAVGRGWAIRAFLYDVNRDLSDWAKGMLPRAETRVALNSDLMAELSGKSDASELLAVVAMRDDDPALLPRTENPLLLLFDRASNHGNLGTIMRSMDALGADGLLLTGHAIDPYDPAVITSTMGSFFKTSFARAQDNEKVLSYIADLRARYPLFQVIGTTSHRQKDISEIDLTRPTMLLIGNETDGLSRAYKEAADELATIPMSEDASASSMNVACATSILLYEAVRQRNRKG